MVQNTAPGATVWPGAPVIATMNNPSSASAGESFNGGGGNTNLSQTFTLASNITLRAVCIYVGTGGGSGTGPGVPLALSLYDLGIPAGLPSRYTANIIGAVGPDYTLLTSTNLTNWQMLFTTNSPASPFSLADANSGRPARFYRLQLGP